MPERISSSFDPVRAAARQARSIAELLDVMWEQERNDGPPPFLSVSQLRVMYIVDHENGIRMRRSPGSWAHRRPPSAAWSTAGRAPTAAAKSRCA